MFMPGRDVEAEKAAQQKIFRNVEAICMQRVPKEFQEACTISVQEIQCGDPQCAPIDTVVTILFDR